MCESQPDDEADEALETARRLTEEGRYREALERHMWYHDHALEISGGHYGVRLSFALSEWFELGKKFSPALQKLKEVRDQKVALLFAGKGDSELFSDVQALNRVLGEPESTVKLFKHLDAVYPELAVEVSDVVIGDLAFSQDFLLARKYLGDPLEEFAWAKDCYERGAQWTQKTGGQQSELAFKRLFVERIVLIASVLSAVGELRLARRVQAKALEVMPRSPVIENLFNRKR